MTRCLRDEVCFIAVDPKEDSKAARQYDSDSF
jgi:hypothetical protein